MPQAVDTTTTTTTITTTETTTTTTETTLLLKTGLRSHARAGAGLFPFFHHPLLLLPLGRRCWCSFGRTRWCSSGLGGGSSADRPNSLFRGIPMPQIHTLITTTHLLSSSSPLPILGWGWGINSIPERVGSRDVGTGRGGRHDVVHQMTHVLILKVLQGFFKPLLARVVGSLSRFPDLEYVHDHAGDGNPNEDKEGNDQK